MQSQQLQALTVLPKSLPQSLINIITTKCTSTTGGAIKYENTSSTSFSKKSKMSTRR